MTNQVRNILLVEDEIIIALAQKKQLENYDYSVEHVNSGARAIDYILQNPESVQLVLMDIDLGAGMDGTEAASRILDQIDIPVVFLSSHTDKEIVEKTERITSYGYVVKQAGITVLDASIKMAYKLFLAEAQERKSRRVLETRLELIAYEREHSLKELLTRTLDLVCGYVDSPIGFYHFVAPDQKTLQLQQWSTETLKKFCKLGDVEMHYPIDKAGIWVDCVREKKPVIHNDYESEKNRKGLPAGHAKISRELVVPVMRDGKILSILGVGNKPEDYTEEDVRTVSYLADVTWQIIKHKQTEEELVSKNELLNAIGRMTAIGGWELDLATNEIMWTEGSYRIYELPLDYTPVLEEVIQYFHAEDLDSLNTYFRNAIDNGEPYDIEVRFITAKGRHIWVRTICMPEIQNGKVVKLRGVFQDISDRKV